MKLRQLTRAVGVCIAVTLGLVSCSAAVDSTAQTYEIAGGDTSGIYFNYASLLADAVHRTSGLEIKAIQTRGSVENLQLVGTGKSILGFTQGDTAADAVLGEGSFAEPLPVRAVARVYDEYVHVVVPADSEVRGLADLSGKTVSLGVQDSGVQVIAARVLHAAEVEISSVTNLALGLEESISAMQRGDIEAFFWVGGLPTPGIDLLSQFMPIRLLSIESSVVDGVNAGHAGVYRLADFPVGFYGLDGSAVTMTVPNYLITGEEAPSELIQSVLEVLFATRIETSRSLAAAGYLDRRQAIFTGPIELHPGAVEYYTSTRH